MVMRTNSRTVVFSYPFEIKGVDRLLPPGEYRVVTDEELIELGEAQREIVEDMPRA